MLRWKQNECRLRLAHTAVELRKATAPPTNSILRTCARVGWARERSIGMARPQGYDDLPLSGDARIAWSERPILLTRPCFYSRPRMDPYYDYQGCLLTAAMRATSRRARWTSEVIE